MACAKMNAMQGWKKFLIFFGKCQGKINHNSEWGLMSIMPTLISHGCWVFIVILGNQEGACTCTSPPNSSNIRKWFIAIYRSNANGCFTAF